MRNLIYLTIAFLGVLLTGCSKGQDGHDGEFITDADGRHFHPRIPFQNSDITTEAQILMDDFVDKHRPDGAIQNVKVESATVDASYTGPLDGTFSFSGRATVMITGSEPFTVGFRERVTGSLVANKRRLLDHWSIPDRSWSANVPAYVAGIDSWRATLAADADTTNVGYRLAQALSVTDLIIDMKDHVDARSLDAWKKANAIAWDKRALINLPLAQ